MKRYHIFHTIGATVDLQTEHRHACINIIRSLETTFAFTVFSQEKALSSPSVTKIATSLFLKPSQFQLFLNAIILDFLDSFS